MFVFFDDSIEERHGWANTCHFIFVVLQRAIVPRIRRPARIPERINQRVQGLPDGDESGRVGGDEDRFLFAEQVGEDRDYCRHGRVVEQNVEEAVAHVRQVVTRVRALNLQAAIRHRFAHWCLDLADDLKDEGLEQVGQPLLVFSVCLDVFDELFDDLDVLVVIVVR